MPARRRSRQRAIQVLYQADIRGIEVDRALHDWYETLWDSEEDPNKKDVPPAERPDRDAFLETLALGAMARREEIDQLIERHAQNWRIERMSVVDRNLLRVAVFEMIGTETPHPVVIDEAVELAKQFSGDDASRFVNGLLDALRKTLEREKQAQQPPAAP